MSLDAQSNSNQPNLKMFKVEKIIFSQPSLSCPATHVDSEKDSNTSKITNNIGSNSATDFSDKNNLSYNSYKVPDQLEVGVFPRYFPNILA